tara:strand:- start:79317 stop:80513 length:1197 start_codon:yes stop_codon:yes gene_type:complete
MEINNLKSILESILIKWVHAVNIRAVKEHRSFYKGFGFCRYVLINRLQNHYVIELLGFQPFTNNPSFIIEDKPNKYDLNFFINGGKFFKDYKGLNPIIKFKDVNDYTCKTGAANLFLTVTKVPEFIEEFFEDYFHHNTRITSPIEECELPFNLPSDSTNIFLHNLALVSQVQGIYSFRRHSTTIVINKNITTIQFKKFLKQLFNVGQIDWENIYGGRFKFQLISELKSLAYLNVDETAIDKFIQLISIPFAKALGYKSAKSNIRLQISSTELKTDKKYLTPDFLLEREDGYYDILDLKLGLLNSDFAFGDWTNSYFSSYAQKLLGQLKGYQRYFSFDSNSDWAFQKYGIKIKNPILIGIAGNHNNFNREVVERALEGNIESFRLINYNQLAELLKTKI